MRQGGSTQRRDSPRTILGQMDCRETQSSCHFHEPFGALAAVDGRGFVKTNRLRLSLPTFSNFFAGGFGDSASTS